jgi:hypothetical protein
MEEITKNDYKLLIFCLIADYIYRFGPDKQASKEPRKEVVDLSNEIVRYIPEGHFKLKYLLNVAGIPNTKSNQIYVSRSLKVLGYESCLISKDNKWQRLWVKKQD